MEAEDGFLDGAQDGAQEEVPRELRSTELNQPIRWPCPERFDGSDNKFEDFAYSLKYFLSAANTLFYDYMVEVEWNLNGFREWHTLNPTQKAISAQLQIALVSVCRGPAAKIVRQTQIGTNGFE